MSSVARRPPPCSSVRRVLRLLTPQRSAKETTSFVTSSSHELPKHANTYFVFFTLPGSSLSLPARVASSGQCACLVCGVPVDSAATRHPATTTLRTV
eukprot:scaffold26463_cov48-Attheya_sp.AAC.4